MNQPDGTDGSPGRLRTRFGSQVDSVHDEGPVRSVVPLSYTLLKGGSLTPIEALEVNERFCSALVHQDPEPQMRGYEVLAELLSAGVPGQCIQHDGPTTTLRSTSSESSKGSIMSLSVQRNSGGPPRDAADPRHGTWGGKPPS